MEPGVTAEDDHIVIGDCLTKDEAEDIIHVLVKDGAVQDLLADAQMRSDQHRHNYATLKTQHQNILHQLKIMETEIVKLETEKHDLQTEISGLVDNAVNEANGLKREIAFLESQLPTEDSQKQFESRIRNETEAVWRTKFSELVEENESLADLISVLQQDNSSLRTTFKSEMQEVQDNMHEAMLEFQSKVNKLEHEKLLLMECPEKEEKISQVLLLENAELKQKSEALADTLEDVQRQNKSLQAELSQARAENQELESGMKLNLRQSAAKILALILGLEKQVECLLAEIAARERDSLAQEDRVRALLKESEGDKERLGEAERSVQVHLSSLEMTKAKELSVLRRELALVTQNKAEQAGTLESLERELSVIKEKHNVEISVRDEEILELKCELEDSQQNFSTKNVELQSKLKGLGMAIHEVEDENLRLKNERSCMVRDFNEDMSRISLQNQDMKEEILYLKDQLATSGRSKRFNQENVIKQEDKKPPHNDPSLKMQPQVNEEDHTDLRKKCRKYNKLIHKLREKIAMFETMGDKCQLEKESMEGLVSAEQHAAVTRQLAELRRKHEQFAAVFSQLEQTDKLKEMKAEKIEAIAEIQQSIAELDLKSSEYLHKGPES